MLVLFVGKRFCSFGCLIDISETSLNSFCFLFFSEQRGLKKRNEEGSFFQRKLNVSFQFIEGEKDRPPCQL